MRPGGSRYRRIRGALAAIPVLILLPSLVMFGFQAPGIDGSSAAPAAMRERPGDLRASPGAARMPVMAPSLEPASSAGSGPVTPEPDFSQPQAPQARLDPTAMPTAYPAGTGAQKPTPTLLPTSAPQPTPKATPQATPRPPSPTPTPVPPQPPAGTSLALGVWSGQPWNPGSLNAVTSLLGRAPGVFLTYVGWDRPFYRSDEQQIADRGASHVVTWQPNGYSLASIASGGQDAFIRAWAQGAAAWGGRIYLRPMHEMNGDWYSWGRGVNGNTPADFVAAWRRMHDIFVAEGATNVKWVWSPNVRYGSNYPLADLYPGSAYVDWLGLDGYNWGLDRHLGQPKWQSFEEIFGATYREVTQLAPGKPLMIAETASTENGGDKAQWILQTFLNDVPKYPAVRAVIWFNEADGASNFRIDSSAAALAAFKQVLNSAAYQGRMP